MCEPSYILEGSNLKSIEFGEGDLKNLSEIGKALFSDEDDPRSSSYNRKLVRPEIHWGRIILSILFPFIIAIAFFSILVESDVSKLISLLLVGVALLVYVLVNLKRTIICGVKIYQRYAPDAIRRKCRFEPSCSEYMILAIEKYGLRKGLKKGVNRLKRCNINDGGYDFP